jgi:hypothetical protein
MNAASIHITKQLNRQEMLPPIWPGFAHYTLSLTCENSGFLWAPFQICSRIFLSPFSPFFKRTVYGPRVQGGVCTICTCIAFTSFVVFSLPNINLGDRLSEDRMMNISTMARGAFTSRLRDPKKGKYTTTYWQLKREMEYSVLCHKLSYKNSTHVKQHEQYKKICIKEK